MSSGISTHGSACWRYRALLLASVLVWLCSQVPVAWALLGQSVTGDFNGDTFADVAIGRPFETIGFFGGNGAGAVRIYYGSIAGLSSVGKQRLHQDTPGIADDAEGGDVFGNALTAADFNGDGFVDLAIGAPGESVGSLASAGIVHILYGSAQGISVTGSQVLQQGAAGLQGVAEAHDGFGGALAAGDFDNDGFADLAIGVPGQVVNARTGAGAVHIVYGSDQGLSAARNRILHQDSSGLLGSAETEDRFGLALAAGDFDNDGFVDLVIGVPGQVVNAVQEAGAVQVVYGSGRGLVATGNRIFHQDSKGFQGKAEMGDVFGLNFAVGDFNGDGFADLSIGMITQDIGSATDAGTVHVVYGSAQGLRATGNRIFHQNIAGIPEQAESDDGFGWALTAGDFNRDGFADLAIGAFGEVLGSFRLAGVVHIVYGAANGVSTVGSQFFHQDVTGMLEQVETGDGFAYTLAAGDFNHDRFSDLAIEVAGEFVQSLSGQGALQVLYGARRRLTVTGNQLFPFGTGRQ